MNNNMNNDNNNEEIIKKESSLDELTISENKPTNINGNNLIFKRNENIFNNIIVIIKNEEIFNKSLNIKNKGKSYIILAFKNNYLYLNYEKYELKKKKPRNNK